MSYKLLEPFKLSSITLRNRIVLPAMGTGFTAIGGGLTERQINYLTRFAKGGVALIIPEGQIVDDKESGVMHNTLSIFHDKFLAGQYELVESVKDEGAAIVAQIAHGGLQSRPECIPQGLQPLAPSPFANPFNGIVAKELDQRKINEIQAAFADCAQRAQKIGYDGVEMHGGQGYLLTEFISPRLNIRKDKYGGSIENRARFALETYEKIRSKTNSKFIVGYRLCADEHVPGGIPPEEVIAFVQMLEKVGIDFIDVVSGTYETIMFCVPPTYIPREVNNLHLSEMIKKAVKNVTVMCAGSLNVEIGEQAIREGKTDLAMIGRGLIADPELPLKLMEGRVEDIRPCIRGNYPCTGRAVMGNKISCEVNPGIGKDAFKITPTKTPKKVLVIGGGVAGMEAARLAAERGHQAILVEREKELGGHVLEAMAADFKKDLRLLMKWLKTQHDKEGVKVRLNTEATPELIKKEKPDVLIIAVGSDYIMPPSLAKYASNFLFPKEVLLGQKQVGDRVVVAGGGLVGCETALHIAESLKKKVIIVEMLDDILLELGFGYVFATMALKDRLQKAGIEIKTGLTLKSYSGNKVVCTDKTGKDVQLDADSVVLALGLQARQDIVTKFKGLAPQVFLIGDCVEARMIYHSFREAWRAVFSF